MTGSKYELVARVGKARGLEGEVTAQSVGNLPFLVYEGLRVHVVPPSLYGPRDVVVSTVLDAPGNSHRLRFEGVDSIDDAEQIAGRYLLAAVDELDGFEEYVDEIGMRVVDERFGDLGVIDEIIETAAHEVWVVHGPHGEVLIPVVDEVIVAYPDDDAQPIRTHVMDGLIES